MLADFACPRELGEPLAWPVVDEEERDGRRAVLGTLEGTGYLIAWEVTGVHVVHGSLCLPVSGCCLWSLAQGRPYGPDPCSPDRLLNQGQMPADQEPVSGIEPLTCRLQGGRSAI